MCAIYSFLIVLFSSFFFFFNDTATTEIYTLSLHDALPIWPCLTASIRRRFVRCSICKLSSKNHQDRKSTRLNSSHVEISYAVFCLKKKKKKNTADHKPRSNAEPAQTDSDHHILHD